MSEPLTLNPAVQSAVGQVRTLFRSMDHQNLGETFEKIDIIRQQLSENDEALVVSTLISIGEI